MCFTGSGEIDFNDLLMITAFCAFALFNCSILTGISMFSMANLSVFCFIGASKTNFNDLNKMV